MGAPLNALSPEMRSAIAEFGERLRDPWWRITGGALYKIKTDEGEIMPFVPNSEQLDFLSKLHHRNVILKARQLGFSTVVAIYFLDHAEWNPNQHCGIVSYDHASAHKLFEKVQFAYENQPAILLPAVPLAKKPSDDILTFANGSKVEVALSMRSATIQRLHVSELAKMDVYYPLRAKEVMTGSLNAVPLTGVAIIEATSEGPSGEFYGVTSAAELMVRQPLSDLDFKFFFYPWWKRQSYRINPKFVTIDPKMHEYFDGVQHEMGCVIDLWQRAWYVAKLRSECKGDVERMWREFPSTPKECWQQSSEGTWFGPQLSEARAQGRIRKHMPRLEHVPVDTFWDIGHSDGCAVWFMQHVHPEYRMIKFIEGWEESFASIVARMEETQFLWGTHYLPHDAEAERQGVYRPYQPLADLQKLRPRWRFEIVPRVDELIHGITALRTIFPQIWFDETECKEGLDHLALYKKRFIRTTQTFADEPVKFTGHSEAADALRQFAQVFENLNPTVRAGQRPRRRRGAYSS